MIATTRAMISLMSLQCSSVRGLYPDLATRLAIMMLMNQNLEQEVKTKRGTFTEFWKDSIVSIFMSTWRRILKGGPNATANISSLEKWDLGERDYSVAQGCDNKSGNTARDSYYVCPRVLSYRMTSYKVKELCEASASMSRKLFFVSLNVLSKHLEQNIYKDHMEYQCLLVINKTRGLSGYIKSLDFQYWVCKRWREII